MNPTDIETMFEINPNDMPKMSSVEGGRPTFTTIYKFQKALNSQALSIPSTNNPDLGFLGEVISTTQYAALNNEIAYVVPQNPGIAPTYNPDATQFQINEAIRLHGLSANEYHIFRNVRTALRNMIVNNIEEKYISALCHPITRYNTRTPLDLMEHIWTTYGKITTSDLTANEERMYTNWNPPTPIETLYEQLTDGQQFALKGGETIHDSQLARKGYEIIAKTGLFNEDCKEWRKKAEDEQTFENFKIFFTAADDDRRKNNATTGSSGYSINTIEQIVHNEMNNILHQWMQPEDPPNHIPTESAPTESAPSIKPAPPTESANTTTLEDIRDELIKLINNHQNKPQLPPYQGKINGENVTYCWSHGITKNRRHNSKTCRRKKEGHQDDATLNNRMGGSNERCRTRNNNSS